jgi:hypothetical protein
MEQKKIKKPFKFHLINFTTFNFFKNIITLDGFFSCEGISLVIFIVFIKKIYLIKVCVRESIYYDALGLLNFVIKFLF